MKKYTVYATACPLLSESMADFHGEAQSEVDCHGVA